MRQPSPLVIAALLTSPVVVADRALALDEELERSISMLDQLDTVRASVNYVDEPLEEVLEELTWLLPSPLTADWHALDIFGVRADDEITLRLEDAPVSSVLAAICLRLGDGFDRPVIEVHAGEVLLTTRDATATMQCSDAYDVRDLLATDAPEELRRTAPPIARPETRPAEGGDEAEPPSGPPPAPLTPGRELMILITEHVDPDAWMEFGGSRASISERDGVLLVSAAPATHRRFRQSLRRLRQVHSTAVSFETALIDVPRAVLAKLERRSPAGSIGRARAVLGAPDAAVRWSATSDAAIGQTLSYGAEHGGVAIEVDLRATLDRATGLLTVSVEAETRGPGDVRSVSSTTTIAFRGGAAIVELPAATRLDEARLLVVIPHRR